MHFFQLIIENILHTGILTKVEDACAKVLQKPTSTLGVISQDSHMFGRRSDSITADISTCDIIMIVDNDREERVRQVYKPSHREKRCFDSMATLINNSAKGNHNLLERSASLQMARYHENSVAINKETCKPREDRSLVVTNIPLLTCNQKHFNNSYYNGLQKIYVTAEIQRESTLSKLNGIVTASEGTTDEPSVHIYSSGNLSLHANKFKTLDQTSKAGKVNASLKVSKRFLKNFHSKVVESLKLLSHLNVQQAQYFRKVQSYPLCLISKTQKEVALKNSKKAVIVKSNDDGIDLCLSKMPSLSILNHLFNELHLCGDLKLKDQSKVSKHCPQLRISPDITHLIISASDYFFRKHNADTILLKILVACRI